MLPFPRTPPFLEKIQPCTPISLLDPLSPPSMCLLSFLFLLLFASKSYCPRNWPFVEGPEMGIRNMDWFLERVFCGILNRFGRAGRPEECQCVVRVGINKSMWLLPALRRNGQAVLILVFKWVVPWGGESWIRLRPEACPADTYSYSSLRRKHLDYLFKAFLAKGGICWH